MAWLLCLLFALLSVQGRPFTPRGIHCPTASVQKVMVAVKTVDCCGREVVRMVERQPREGEQSFVQCQCAEKKSPKSVKASGGGEAGSHPLVIWAAEEENLLALPVLDPCGQPVGRPMGQVVSRASAPPTPPPDRA